MVGATGEGFRGCPEREARCGGQGRNGYED